MTNIAVFFKTIGQIFLLWLIYSLSTWIVETFHLQIPGSVTSHGQGTATILQEGIIQGAMAGVAMAVAAIFISFIAPFYIPWLVNL